MSIQSEIDRLMGIRADLKAALAEKGQTVGDVFSTYPAAVRAISSGSLKSGFLYSTGGDYTIEIPEEQPLSFAAVFYATQSPSSFGSVICCYAGVVNGKKESYCLVSKGAEGYIGAWSGALGQDVATLKNNVIDISILDITFSPGDYLYIGF